MPGGQKENAVSIFPETEVQKFFQKLYILKHTQEGFNISTHLHCCVKRKYSVYFCINRSSKSSFENNIKKQRNLTSPPTYPGRQTENVVSIFAETEVEKSSLENNIEISAGYAHFNFDVAIKIFKVVFGLYSVFGLFQC